MDTIITSAANASVKQLRKLMTSAKARREMNTYVAEGIHVTRSYLETGNLPIRYVLAQSALQNTEVVQLTKELDSKSIERIILADSLFESLSDIHADVGIALLFAPKVPLGAATPLDRNALLLENIQDPGNLGTIFRTAAAVGVRDIFLSAGCTSPWSPKALRAGMGAQFSLLIHENADLADVAQTATISVLATTLGGESLSLYDLDLTQPQAWIFGNEGQGISTALSELVSSRVFIPQESAVESLNVAAATAVCLFEQYRQCLQNTYKA